MLNANYKQLRYSAKTKNEAAEALINGRRLHPEPAVYLSHVALECAFKLRILIKNRVTDIDGLRRYLPTSNFNDLFSGAKGHDLHYLSKTAGLKRYLEARGHDSLLAQKEWSALGRQRPYSLRYGIEKIDVREAKKQIRYAAKLADLVLKEAT